LISLLPALSSDSAAISKPQPFISDVAASPFCLDALEEAIALYGAPEIFNTAQGSQFTSEALPAS
jgi:transposase InsO family protein